ncbi:hypothetical protein I4641_09565 [Waterburya agarophytonicola K14]|uniref:Uncharacterized protein n=1 Tax=Waterburya agarophytonicola KI4 TaxID=2874699 RepID=A0A964FH27_9CYAN|nr:hypothetical protein [Waterburya agarophytonicola]MCC0177224.1 hypothetical protein [Waterburya agarophytonicola KI4]
MTQYVLAIPQVDSSLPWHRVKVFDSKVEAVKYSDDNLGTDNGWYCMLSYDGEYYIADTIHPNLSPSNNPHLAIDVFHHRADCIKYIQANYNSDSEGIIYLISEV